MVVDCTACGRTVWFPDETAGTHQKCFYCNRETLVSTSLPRTENPLGLISYEEKTTRKQKEPSLYNPRNCPFLSGPDHKLPYATFPAAPPDGISTTGTPLIPTIVPGKKDAEIF